MRNLSYKFDLSRLSAFIAVCEEASITQAAVRLGVAQPALSATIRRLEADLGNTLFRRLPRGMDVTDAGKLLLERSYEIFSLVQDAERGLLTTAEEPQGEVAIGLPPSAAAVLTYPLLTLLKRKYPRVAIRLVEAMSGYLQGWLENREISIAVTFNTPSSESIVSRRILREDIMLIGRCKDLEELPSPYPLEKLDQLPLIVTSARHGLRRNMENHLASVGRKLNIKYEIDAGHQLVRMVSSGEGFGIFARSAFHAEIAGGLVAGIPLIPAYSRDVCICHHRSASADRAVQLTAEEVRTLAHTLARNGTWPAGIIEAGQK